MEKEYAIGIDLGGTSVKYALIDNEGVFHFQGKLPSKADVSAEAVIGQLVAAINEVKAFAKEQDCRINGIGIGTPGIVDCTNRIVLGGAENIKGWENLCLADRIEAETGIPVLLGNDANLMGLGETMYGAGKGATHVVFLTVGTGIGGAVVIDGKLFNGFANRGTELGHVPLIANGEPCACGSVGCLEHYASTSALIQYGLELGNKFGIMASTDQHSGYPGSYGDGRIGVLAPSLTRDAIWDALRTRHVCAATGDKILIDFRLNDAFMGDVVRGNSRRIYVNVTGESCIDYVDIIKNGQILARMNGPLTPVAPEGDTVRCKVKMDFGWNREEQYVHWQGKLSLDKGKLHGVTPCFRGAAFTSPQEGETEFHTHVNRIVSVNDKETELDMYSSKNPNTTTAAMQAVILDVEMPKDGKIIAEFNGKKFEHTLGELLEGSRSHFMIGWLSEAILFNRAMPESCFTVEHYMEDKEPQRDTDYYYVRARQRDGQWAWSSPIWAERV